MAFIAIPKPSILDRYDYLGLKNNQKLWRSKNGRRHYTWDGLHGEVEVFDRRGHHLGSLDAICGRKLKDAENGRRIDVS